jgi:hypothetical protein
VSTAAAYLADPSAAAPPCYQEGVGGRPAGDQLFGDRPDLVDLAREAIPILTLWVDEPREDPSEAMTDLSDMVRSGATLPM